MKANDCLADPRRLVAELFAEILRPPPPIDFNHWAVEKVKFGPESPFPGPFDPDRFPFFRRPLEVLQPDDPARVVSVGASAQVGKTMIAQIFVAGSLDLDPGPVMYTHPTENNAIRWARTKWRPQIRSTPRLGEIFDRRQSKEGGNSTLYQERRDGRGFILVGGANSAASLSMVSVPRQVQDDLSKWTDNEAGDPEYQADNRSKAFAAAKILKLSTPLLKGSCRITRALENGTDEHFHVPCPHCGHRHALDPENLIAHLDPDHPERAGFACPECGGWIEEKHRRAMVLAGEWVAHNPRAPDPSFSIWAAYAPLESWERIARSWLAAKGDPAAEQTWWNDTAGRAYELPGEAPDWESLKARAEQGGRPRGEIPREAGILTLAFDCQDDFVDGMLVGWGRDLGRWIIDRVTVEGHISTPETRAELNELVERGWPVAGGGTRRADLVGIDANAWTDEVFDWAKRWPKNRVVMVRGIAGDAAPSLALVRRERRRDGTLVKYQGRFYNVGVSPIKGGFYKLLRVAEPGRRGYVGFPAGLDDDFYEQLTAEKRTPRLDRKGFSVYEWLKPKGRRNEMLDCMVYGEALAGKLGWRTKSAAAWDALAGGPAVAAPRLTLPPPGGKPAFVPAPTKKSLREWA